MRSLRAGTGISTPAAGEIRATGNVVAFTSSDRQFKTNIETIKNALDIVMNIDGVTFDWTDDYIQKHGGEDGYFIRKSDFGLIAQDLKDAFPLAVRLRKDGSLSVDYEKLCSLAFAAIKELKQEIDNLKKSN